MKVRRENVEQEACSRKLQLLVSWARCRIAVGRDLLLYSVATGLVLLIGCVNLKAQQPALPDALQPQPQNPQASPAEQDSQGQYGKHHILWIIPNYRSDESTEEFKPLSPREKFTVAIDDSFDPTAFLVAGVFAGTAMVQHQYPSFGQGAAGFGKYYGGAFADQAIGNMMTEALLPIALHQDPRYFTKGKGGFLKRTGYAISREVVTRNDDGRNHFNTPELLGNAVAAGISNAYYPAADRSLGNTFNKWGQQIGLDTGFNIMKEFGQTSGAKCSDTKGRRFQAAQTKARRAADCDTSSRLLEVAQ